MVVAGHEETIFLMTLVFCVWSRGHGSEAMKTPYHFRSDLCLQWRSCRSGFIVLFPHYLSSKHETFRYSVQLGTLCKG